MPFGVCNVSKDFGPFERLASSLVVTARRREFGKQVGE